MNTKYFEVSVLQNKDTKLHPDVTKPQVALKPDSNGNKGRYFHISVKTPMQMVNGFNISGQTKRITFTIFENGNRSETFKEIEALLSDPQGGYTINPNKTEAKFDKSVYAVAGDLRVEPTGFLYKVEINGKLVDRDNVQEFIFASEADQGADEIIMAAAHRRAAKTRIVTEDDKTATTVVG